MHVMCVLCVYMCVCVCLYVSSVGGLCIFDDCNVKYQFLYHDVECTCFNVSWLLLIVGCW